MPKKLALFILGLMLAVGAFLLYQYVSGARPGVIQKGKPATSSAIQSLPPSIEERDPEGNLIYLIRAKNAPTPVMADGKPVPNQYTMEAPEATFYQFGGRIVRLTADTCQIVLDQAPRMPVPGLGGKLKDQINLRSGTLKGNVRLYVSGLTNPATKPATNPSDKSKDVLPGGARVYFDGPVRYDRAQDQLTTADDVHIRSSTASYDGTGLKLSINQQAKRIDFLRIEKCKEILLANQGSRFLEDSDFGLVPATAPASAPASRPGKKESPPTIYDLTMASNIHASSGNRSIAAEKLHVIFPAANDTTATTNPATNPATEPAAASAPAPALAAVPALIPEAEFPDMSGAPEPIAAAGEKDLHLTSDGPLELRPVINDNPLSGSGDMIVEASGSPTSPVRIASAPKGGQPQNIAAGRLYLHRAINVVQLDPGDFGHVEIGEAGKGSIECIAMNFEKNNATLKGPGKVTSYPTAGEKGGVSTITWKKQLALEMEQIVDSSDPKSPNKTIWVPRHALLDNAVVHEIKRDAEDAAHKVLKTTDFSSDLLDIWITTLKSDKKLVQVPNQVLATGNVNVDVQDDRRREQTALRGADMMKIISAETPTGPVFSQFTATGKVAASRRQDKSVITKENPNPAPDYESQVITAPNLIAKLRPKPKTTTKPAATETAPADIASTKPSNTLDAFDADVEVSHFVASDGVTIDIQPPTNGKRSSIHAVADHLTADPSYDKDGKQNFKADLMAAADPKSPRLRLQYGVDYLESRNAHLDSEASSISVQGPGVFDVMLPAKKSAAKDKDGKPLPPPPPTPMRMTWDEKMVYDGVAHLATIDGHPEAIMAGGESPESGKLSATDTILVQLKVKTPTTAPATAPATKPGSNSPAIASEDLDLAWIRATGNVRAAGAQFVNKKKVRDLAFTALDVPGKQGVLYYDAEHDLMQIPGKGVLVLQTDGAPKANGQTMDTNGDTVFMWEESLEYNGKEGSIIFKKDVDFTFTPRDGFKFSQNLANLNNTGTRGAAGRGAAAAVKPKDTAHLKTQLLTATLVKKPDTRPADTAATQPTVAQSPLGLDASQLNVDTVNASDGAYIDVSGIYLAGKTLSYKVPEQSIVIKDPTGVVISRPAYSERATAPVIILNMSKESDFFSTPNGMQGKITGLGGK